MKARLYTLSISLIYILFEWAILVVTVDEFYHGCIGGYEIGILPAVDLMIKYLYWRRIKATSGLAKRIMQIFAWCVAGYMIFLFCHSTQSLSIDSENKLSQLLRCLIMIGTLCFPVFLIAHRSDKKNESKRSSAL